MQAIEGSMEEGPCEDPGESGEWFQLQTGLSLTSQESSGARRVLWGLSAYGMWPTFGTLGRPVIDCGLPARSGECPPE